MTNWPCLRAKRHTSAAMLPPSIRAKECALSESIAANGTRLDEVLAAAWVTRGLSWHALARLAELGTLRSFAATDVLMREGEATAFLAVVLEGRVALRLRVPERGPVTIMTVEPGDIVGWSALVPPFRATSTAMVMVATDLAYFEGSALRTALAADPELAAEFYPVVLGAVARRLEGTRQQLLDLFSFPQVEPW